MTAHRIRGLATLGALVGLSACQGMEEHEKRTGAEPDASLGVTISELQVVGADEGHVPTFANGNFGQLRLGGKERTEEAAVSALRPSLLAVSKVFHADPAELAFQRAVTDGMGDRHFVYVQRKHGREVLGAALVLHTTCWGRPTTVTRASSTAIPTTARAPGSSARSTMATATPTRRGAARRIRCCTATATA
ncbi:hypothetical protein D7V80_08115 [Corallococcus sp. CA054B]|nr:hypothetical protein D7V80_08115 [Corallococcus sp. CA054B]